MTAREPGAARRSRACATSARTSARRSWARRSRASNFGENWISIDPNADYDETVAPLAGRRRRLPGPVPQRPDLPARAHRRGARPARASRSWCASSATTSASCGEAADRSRTLIADVPGIDGLARRRCRPRCRRSTVEVDLATARAATASSRATCAAPPATLVAGEEVGDIFRGGKAYDVMVWSTPETRDSLDGDPQPADRHARPAGRCGSADVADVAIRPTPNVIQHENASRRIDVGADVQGPRPRRGGRRIQDRLRRVDFPLGYHAELLGETAERQSAAAPAAALGVGRRRS